MVELTGRSRARLAAREEALQLRHGHGPLGGRAHAHAVLPGLLEMHLDRRVALSQVVEDAPAVDDIVASGEPVSRPPLFRSEDSFITRTGKVCLYVVLSPFIAVYIVYDGAGSALVAIASGAKKLASATRRLAGDRGRARASQQIAAAMPPGRQHCARYSARGASHTPRGRPPRRPY